MRSVHYELYAAYLGKKDEIIGNSKGILLGLFDRKEDAEAFLMPKTFGEFQGRVNNSITYGTTIRVELVKNVTFERNS